MHFLLTITLYTRFAIGALHSKFEKKTWRLRQLRDFIGDLIESDFYQKNYLHRWEKLLRRIWNLTLKGKAFSFFQNIFIRKRSEEQKKKKSSYYIFVPIYSFRLTNYQGSLRDSWGWKYSCPRWFHVEPKTAVHLVGTPVYHVIFWDLSRSSKFSQMGRSGQTVQWLHRATACYRMGGQGIGGLLETLSSVKILCSLNEAFGKIIFEPPFFSFYRISGWIIQGLFVCAIRNKLN